METLLTSEHESLVHNFQESIKKLDCIYAIADLVTNPDANFDQTMQHITNRVPLGFRDPDHMCVRVTVNNKVVETANIKNCQWKLAADITANGKIVGKLEAGYLVTLPSGNSPFLEEEKKLLQVVADLIGMVVQRKMLNGFRKLIKNALVGITQTNFRDELLFANYTYLHMFGYKTLEEASPFSFLSMFRDPENRKAFMEKLQQTGMITNFEVECITKAEDPVFLLCSATLESGILTVIMMDITKLKQLNQSLVKNEAILHEIQRIAHLGSWNWDIVTGEMHCSDELYRIHGLRPHKSRETYEDILAHVHPDDRQLVNDVVKQSLANHGRSPTTEYRIMRPDGSARTVLGRGEVIFDKNRRPINMIGTVQDITERKSAEQKLQKAFDEIKVLKDKLEAENIYLHEEMRLRDGLLEIIGGSDPIKYVIKRICQVAQTKTTVLLTGETGTGKGIFARYLHRMSDRKDKPFINVNCAALPASLIESTLFGREKGAFTGSTSRQIGFFELANHGSIFLDEIGELPLELQAKLLKIIEDGEFERIGSPNPIRVDVRIITSTNLDLTEAIRQGRFRQDIYFRLNVFPITIPPLRDRREDIPLLVHFFTRKFSNSCRKKIKDIAPKTIEVLQNYPWPGNVRELINVIERAVILSDGPELQLAETIDQSSALLVSDKSFPMVEVTETENMVEVERKHILHVLRQAGWKIEGPGGAARILGLHPSTLRGRMRKLNIGRPSLD